MKWNKVTLFSKLLTAFLFIVIPFIAFYLGMQYGFLIKDATGAGVEAEIEQNLLLE